MLDTAIFMPMFHDIVQRLEVIAYRNKWIWYTYDEIIFQDAGVGIKYHDHVARSCSQQIPWSDIEAVTPEDIVQVREQKIQDALAEKERIRLELEAQRAARRARYRDSDIDLLRKLCQEYPEVAKLVQD